MTPFLRLPWLAEGLCTLTLTIHCLLKSRAFHWYISDENIYYYLARDLSIDRLPYRDFFYANPPLLLFLLKIGGSLSEWSAYGLRMVPFLAHVGGALFLFLSLRRALWTLAILPVWLYLWSFDAVRASTHSTGIAETLLFVMGALLAATRGAGAWSGAMLGLALLTKTYAVSALPGVALAIWLFSENKRGAIARFASVLVGMLVLCALLGTLVGGKAYWDMNLFYHLTKDADEADPAETFRMVAVRNQATLFILALSAVVGSFGVLSARGGREKNSFPDAQLPRPTFEFLAVGGTLFLCVLAFLGMQQRVFDFYFLLFLPGVGYLCAGFLIPAASLASSGGGPRIHAVAGGMLMLSLLLLAQPMIPGKWRLFLREQVTYWEHEGRHVDVLREWVPVIGGPNATLSGDSGAAPTLALLSGARLALGEADTNYMRFQGGFPSAEEFIRRLEEARVEWLVVRGRPGKNNRWNPRGLFSLKEFNVYALERFDRVAMLKLDRVNELMLLRRKPSQGRTPPDGESGGKADRQRDGS
ncbi:MAG: hypothetical protein GHCLOJNM_04525 [bacterium]|nr:hypothetical protein [bacterium]